MRKYRIKPVVLVRLIAVCMFVSSIQSCKDDITDTEIVAPRVYGVGEFLLARDYVTGDRVAVFGKFVNEDGRFFLKPLSAGVVGEEVQMVEVVIDKGSVKIDDLDACLNVETSVFGIVGPESKIYPTNIVKTEFVRKLKGPSCFRE